MSHSSESINLGNCYKNPEFLLSRDITFGQFTWDVAVRATRSEGLTLLATQPSAIWMPKSKRNYHQIDFDILVKEYTVTNTEYFRNTRMAQSHEIN